MDSFRKGDSFDKIEEGETVEVLDVQSPYVLIKFDTIIGVIGYGRVDVSSNDENLPPVVIDYPLEIELKNEALFVTKAIRKGIDTIHSNQKVSMDFLQQHLPVKDSTTEIINAMIKALDLIIKAQKRTQWIWIINFITLAIPILVLTISLVIYYLIHQ